MNTGRSGPELSGPESGTGAGTAGNYLYYLAPSIAQGGVSMLMVPLVTHYLEPREFGVFAIIVAITLPVKSLVASGARWVIGGNYFRVAEDARRSMLFNVVAFELLLRSAVVLLFFLTAEPLLRWLVSDYRPVYVHYLNLVLVGALAGSLWPAVSFVMTVRNEARAFAFVSIVQILVNAIAVVVCLAFLQRGVESLFIAIVASSCISLIFELLYMRKSIDFAPDRRWFDEIVKTGLQATPGGLAELAANMTDKIIIQRWVGLHALGLYSHSQQYQSVFKMVTAALGNTLNSQSLKIYSRELPSQPLERKLSAWYGLLAVLGVLVALFTDDLVLVLTHGKFVGAAPLVLIWYVIVFALSYAIPFSAFLMATKRNRVLMHTQMIPTLAGIALVVLGAYYYGARGAAWALVATSWTIQMSRRWAAHVYGYNGIAEGRFLTALAIYIGVWMGDWLLSLTLLQELCAAVVLIAVIVMRFRLVAELRSALLKN